MPETADGDMKILIADDHALFREGLRHVLLQLGVDVAVIEAPNCEQALSLSASNPDLDLALLDLKMPGMGGFEAMSLLLERSPALPIVVLSSSEDPVDMRHALEGVYTSRRPWSGKARSAHNPTHRPLRRD